MSLHGQVPGFVCDTIETHPQQQQQHTYKHLKSIFLAYVGGSRKMEKNIRKTKNVKIGAAIRAS